MWKLFKSHRKQINLSQERIYGIRQGSAGSSDGNNFGGITQEELAEQIGIDQRQLSNYKKLNDLIPELQSLIENGSMKATVGYKIWAKMPQEDLICTISNLLPKIKSKF